MAGFITLDWLCLGHHTPLFNVSFLASQMVLSGLLASEAVQMVSKLVYLLDSKSTQRHNTTVSYDIIYLESGSTNTDTNIS